MGVLVVAPGFDSEAAGLLSVDDDEEAVSELPEDEVSPLPDSLLGFDSAL